MNFKMLHSPVNFLQQMVGDVPHLDVLKEYEAWWEAEGKSISAMVDRNGTPWLRMFDVFGKRGDAIGSGNRS